MQSDNIDLQERANSYEQALAAADKDIVSLQNNNSILESNNIDLKQKVNELQSEVDSLRNESEHSEKIALAESYATSGKYDLAIPVLNSISQKNGEVVALLKDYTAIYENLIVTSAEALANDGKFDEAVTLIDEALKILPNSQELIDKKKNVTPQYLVDVIECFKANNLRLLGNKEYIKMSGKSYRHAIYSEQSDPVWSMFNSAYSANAFYNLDGKYSQLSGIVEHVDFSGSGTISKNNAGQVYDAEVVIWGMVRK